ncbi:MAG TPA: sulfate transporter CysZ [Nitrospiraceae bacterium]|nr:sulfate transporter CysZ [Nitrospiraceae bacterium]
MFQDIIAGSRYVMRGIRLILSPGLKQFFAIPLLINIVIFSVLIWLGIGQFGKLMEWLLPGGSEWWARLSLVVLWLLFAIAALVILFFGFTVVANLLGAPFNGLLAEKVEAHLRGKTQQEPGSLRTAFPNISQSLMNEVRKIAYYLLFGGLVLLLSFIPGINVVSPVLWVVFGAWMLSLEYMGYPMENHNMNFKRVRERLAEKRMISLGFGLGVLLATMIPLVNFIIMPAAVAGATALWVDHWSVGQGS